MLTVLTLGIWAYFVPFLQRRCARCGYPLALAAERMKLLWQIISH